MSPPRLSVVMPSHNRASDLPRAAHSVLSQTYRDLELIIVDDGSSDDTSHALARLSEEDGRVRFVRNEQSVGPAEARNHGIALAQGELLAFCDDDDAWLPEAATTLVDFLDKHPDVGVVSSWHEVLQVGKERRAIYRGPLHFGDRHLLWMNFVALPFGMVKRSVFPDQPWFDPKLPPSEDWEFWLRCAQRRPIAMLPKVLYQYRQHGGGRVTKAASGQARGRRALLAKHQEAMSPACGLYHRAVADLTEGGRVVLARQLALAARASPRDTAFVSFLLAASLQSSAVGIRRRDPGLPARVLARLIGEQRG